MRLGLKFTRHDHIPEMYREVWCNPFSPDCPLLDAPDRLLEIHNTSKLYIAGIPIKSYPYNAQVLPGCTMFGFIDEDKDKFLGDFMRHGHVERLASEMEGISLQDARNAYNTTRRTGQITTEERFIRRLMDAEELQINS